VEEDGGADGPDVCADSGADESEWRYDELSEETEAVG